MDTLDDEEAETIEGRFAIDESMYGCFVIDIDDDEDEDDGDGGMSNNVSREGSMGDGVSGREADFDRRSDRVRWVICD